MVDWPVVAAFIGPLIGAISLVAGLFVYLNRQREKRVAQQIKEVTSKLEANVSLMQQRIDQIDSTLLTQSRQLEKQGDSLLAAVQSIARIEGRLSGSGPVVTNPLSSWYGFVTKLDKLPGRLNVVQPHQPGGQNVRDSAPRDRNRCFPVPLPPSPGHCSAAQRRPVLPLPDRHHSPGGHHVRRSRRQGN